MAKQAKSSSGPGGREPPAGGACPVCGKPAAARSRPFCSPRCADVDLQRWLSGVYVIPTSGDRDPDDPSGEGGRDA